MPISKPVTMSRHATERFKERTDGVFDHLPVSAVHRIMGGVVHSGIELSGQKGADLAIGCTVEDNGAELVFILEPVYRVRTVLTLDQFTANNESAHHVKK